MLAFPLNASIASSISSMPTVRIFYMRYARSSSSTDPLRHWFTLARQILSGIGLRSLARSSSDIEHPLWHLITTDLLQVYILDGTVSLHSVVSADDTLHARPLQPKMYYGLCAFATFLAVLIL